MASLLLAFGLIAAAMAGLALGVMAGRAPLKGSCGGLGCDACGRACKRKAGGSDAG